ncbi:S28 family serine protease [Nocardioides pelophilus]|uniref:S28 family serine protease n=1 Tax=Nocardioides pelophilus TaxID=2172019 RepID=UPI00406BC1E7
MAGRLRALVCTAAAVLTVPLLAAPPAPALEPTTVRPTVPATGSPATASSTTAAPSPMLQRIRRMGIVAKATEVPGSPRGTRFFRITVSVPVDHARPDGPTFGLRVNLLHRGSDRPTVVETAGYQLWNDPYRSEVTRIVDGNQIDIEHRFFAPSLPANPDWATQLTIRQVAADHHRVISVFRKLYDGRWLSTGDSKGGMAATYHRRWYPSDVTGTIAYVAPNDAVDSDDAYPAFLARVGGPRLDDCRDRLVALQRRMLQRRGWFRGRLEAFSAANGLTWRYVGSLDRGLEASVIDFYFAFWQYWGAEACASVPAARRLSNSEVWRYAGLVNPWRNLSDQRRFYSAPYHYQAAAQIGGPKPYEGRLRDLLEYPGANTPANVLPPALRPVSHDPTAMADIDAWVRTSGRRMLFVNGQFDPWAAEPFRCGADGRDRSCRSVTVPRGSHGALIQDLPRRVRLGVVREVGSGRD